MGTLKTTVSGLAETQMSSMGSNPSPAPASNLRLTGSGRLNALLECHHLRCVWVIKRPFSSSISKQNLTPAPPSGQRGTAFRRDHTTKWIKSLPRASGLTDEAGISKNWLQVTVPGYPLLGPQHDSGQKCLETRVGFSLYSHSVVSLLLALPDHSPSTVTPRFIA